MEFPGNHKDAHLGLKQPELAAVNRLLIKNDLPDSDLTEESMAHFLCYGNAASPDGVIGLELYGDDALLRSLVVNENSRKTGCGTILVNAIESLACELGVRNLYLLTTTAEDYFARKGYRLIDRAEVSDGIRASSEFSSLCPSSAAVMRKPLS
ncbi:MAG: arsenic resistance N-acetyltransferase ArsN2 [Pseudomonadales bacterium]